MKTPEDEAFDDLARRQGAWGGGFPAKRAMAADKLQEPEREALKLALEALDALCLNDYSGYEMGKRDTHLVDTAITAIKAALAQPAQEPVAWGFMNDAGAIYDCISPEAHDECEGEYNVPLYTTPPQRPWVGLTEEDRKAALLTAYKEWECEELLLCAREDYLLIERALKEKNNG